MKERGRKRHQRHPNRHLVKVIRKGQYPAGRNRNLIAIAVAAAVVAVADTVTMRRPSIEAEVKTAAMRIPIRIRTNPTIRRKRIESWRWLYRTSQCISPCTIKSRPVPSNCNNKSVRKRNAKLASSKTSSAHSGRPVYPDLLHPDPRRKAVKRLGIHPILILIVQFVPIGLGL